MTECVSCGGTLGADARFCPSCGATAPAPPPAGGASGGAPAGPPACPVCAAVLLPDARFCGECGTPLAGSGSQIPGPVPAPPTYQRPAPAAYAPGPRQPGSDFFSRFTPFDWVIIGAALLACVGAFLPRYTWASEGYSQSQNAWDSTWAGLAVVLCIVAGIIVVIKVVDDKTPISGAVVMICGGIATLFMFIEFVRRPSGDYVSPSFGVGIFLCTAAAIAVAVAGYLRWQKERAAVPLMASGGGAWATSPPPPARPTYAPPQSAPQPYYAAAPSVAAVPSVPPVAAAGLPPVAAAAPAVAAVPHDAPWAPAAVPDDTPYAAAAPPADLEQPVADLVPPAAPPTDPPFPDEAVTTVSAPTWEPSDLAVEAPEASAGVSDETADTLVSEPFRPVFCGNCGERLSGRPFCKSCGQRVDG